MTEAETETTETTEFPQTTASPRIRWGAIAWGFIVCALAVMTMVITGSPENRTAFVEWLGRLTPGTMWLMAVFVVGGFILLLGLLAALRRGGRAR